MAAEIYWNYRTYLYNFDTGNRDRAGGAAASVWKCRKAKYWQSWASQDVVRACFVRA